MLAPCTVIITTFNEADNIERCIESVRSLTDDILVVDSFSTDATVMIAERLGAKVLQRTYQGPADQKNWAIPQAQHEWILLLDADETAHPDLTDEIKTLLSHAKGPPNQLYWIRRNNHFLGQRVRFSGWQGDQVIRFFHRDHGRYNDQQVHEEVMTEGKTVGILTHRLEHYTFRSLDHYLDKTRRYARWSAVDHRGKTGAITPYHLLLKPLFRFFKHYVIQQGFRDRKVGLIVSAIMAWGVFLRYVYILEGRGAR